MINEGQILKDMGLTNDQLGPAVAGAYDRSTGKIYTAINDYDGKIPAELAPIISDIAIYVNRTLGTSKPVVEMLFETCPHCRYILDGFTIISNN